MSLDDLTETDRMTLEGSYWWGVPTLFRCPLADSPDECDVALVGVPHSTGNGSTERDQHLGPRAVRDVSAIQRRIHGVHGFSPWELREIRDLGDVPLPRSNDNEDCIARIAAFYAAVAAAGARPVSIGGDHSITGGIVRGLTGEGASSPRQPVSLVHFDAHIDAYDSLEHWYGARASAAHWAGYLSREGRVDASHSVQIGIRGNTRTPNWLSPSEELGYRVVPMSEYRQLGGEACVKLIREAVGDRPVYITFDLDCLDPSVAPAVSNLEPAYTGWTVDEAFGLVRGLRGLDVVGADVVCLMPTKDSPNHITAMVAAAAMFELVCLTAEAHAAVAAPAG